MSFGVLLQLVLLCLLTVQQGFPQTNPRKFYKYDVIATQSSSLNVFASPSINDYGDVAFAGFRNPGGGTVFLSQIGQPNVDLMTANNPQQVVSGTVQINDSRQVIAHSSITGTVPLHNFLRRINGVDDFTLIAAAATSPFHDFDQIWSGSTSINNDGEAVFLTRQGNNTTILATGERPNFSTLQFPSSGDSLRPMISDLGCVVVRAGANLTDPLRLYTPDLAEFETIASISDGFTAIGQSPGISNFCEVIVFYGDLNAAGAETLGTNPGPGIFASIETDKTKKLRKIVRLAGRLIEDNSAPGGNDDGYCDPGEVCMQGELGFNQAGSPIFFNFFAPSNRVAIAHQSVGTAGIEDDIFVVSFLGTPNIANDNPARPFSNQFGLWTLTTQIKNEGGVFREKPAVAVPVIQVGDVVNARTITGINVYDQIASVRTPGSPAESPGDHRLAFHVATNNGNMILRANRNVETPVIFIPGIMGSRLAEVNGSTQTERWPGIGVGLLTGANLERLRPSQNANIAATDVIRTFLPGDLGPIYGPILTTLSMTGGLREYQVESKPERREPAGCDMTQRFNDPRLFVFAYDWRKSNIENADLLRDYVECIQQFHPGTKVDIVAHSMGGLLGRRYIIANATTHNVRKMISIGSPFLGAPEALHVTETGKPRFLAGLLGKVVPKFVTNKIRNLAIESPAVHELFPSEGYFTLGGRPFAEETFDINGNGVVPQEYNYPEIFDFYNFRFSTTPYFTNEVFHGFTGQDDWRQDTSGVEYFHIFGERLRRDTIARIIAEPKVRKPTSIIRQDFSFRVKRDFGDQTVPRLSAERIGLFNYNFPNATLRPFVAENRQENSRYSHLGLVKATEVQDQVLTYLDLPFQPSVFSLNYKIGGNAMPSYEYKANSGLSLDQLRPPPGESYYVTIVGTDRLEITDDLGNTNTPIGDDGFELAVPDVGYSGGIYSEVVNIGYHGLDMPADEGEYTIKFRTATNSIDIEVLRGADDSSPNMAIRYIDLDLPANVECLMTFNPQGVPDLSYDSNGDGTYDTVVPAHVRVSGTAAQDVTAPAVTLIYSKRSGQGRNITINAADAESGVQTVYYRVGETGNYQVYSGTFFLHLPIDKVVEAFADDNVGNRSSPIRVVVPKWSTLP